MNLSKTERDLITIIRQKQIQPIETFLTVYINPLDIESFEVRLFEGEQLPKAANRTTLLNLLEDMKKWLGTGQAIFTLFYDDGLLRLLGNQLAKVDHEAVEALKN